jgi:hypothetical protein
MNKFTITLLLCLGMLSGIFASRKVYLVHGFAGLGLEMVKLQFNLNKNGINNEIFDYPSLIQDIDTVSGHLYRKIREENIDSVSFITHSMGALVVRSLYNFIKPGDGFPKIIRIVIIAPPNKGTPLADFFIQSKIISHLAGPNIRNLTTNPVTGASRYPIPTCEVGVILGVSPFKKGYNIFLEENNDGIVIPKYAKLGIERDIAFVKATHNLLLAKNEVINMSLNFLKTGKLK